MRSCNLLTKRQNQFCLFGHSVLKYNHNGNTKNFAYWCGDGRVVFGVGGFCGEIVFDTDY